MTDGATSDPKRPLSPEELADIRTRVAKKRPSGRELTRAGYASEDRERLLWHVDFLEAEIKKLRNLYVPESDCVIDAD